MPKYFPITVVPTVKASASDLIQLLWKLGRQGEGDGITADFFIPDNDDFALRVGFDTVIMLRILDEMPLSTEDEEISEGLISEHFAYRVENAKFWRCQSELQRASHENAKHYRFVTGWTCLDVLAYDEPRFTVVPRPEGYSSGWRDD